MAEAKNEQWGWLFESAPFCWLEKALMLQIVRQRLVRVSPGFGRGGESMNLSVAFELAFRPLSVR
jgi:hypothetical protein